MALKRDRNYRLIVDTRNSATTVAGPNGPSLPGTLSGRPGPGINSIQIQPPFSIDFDIQKTNIPSANQGTISIYNLAPATRTRIHKDRWETDLYLFCELWAGYGSGEVPAIQEAFNGIVTLQEQLDAQNAARQLFPRIFRGNILQATSFREGSTFITRLTVQDGGNALVNSQFARTYAAGTRIDQIIADVMGALQPTVAIGAIGNFPGVISRSNSFCGNPFDILQNLTNGNVFIQDEKAYALAPNDVLQPLAVPVLDDNVGIIGVPIRGTGYVQMRIVFEPGIFVGQKIQLKVKTASYYNGPYRVVGVSHKGTISETVCGRAETTLTLESLDPNFNIVVPR